MSRRCATLTPRFDGLRIFHEGVGIGEARWHLASLFAEDVSNLLFVNCSLQQALLDSLPHQLDIPRSGQASNDVARQVMELV